MYIIFCIHLCIYVFHVMNIHNIVFVLLNTHTHTHSTYMKPAYMYAKSLIMMLFVHVFSTFSQMNTLFLSYAHTYYNRTCVSSSSVESNISLILLFFFLLYVSQFSIFDRLAGHCECSHSSSFEPACMDIRIIE